VKFLVAIDGSPASTNAVRFVAEFLGQTKMTEHSITLFHVTESLPNALLSPGIPQSLGPAYQEVIEDAMARRKAEGERLLEAMAAILRSAGIPSDRILTKLDVESARPESSKVAAALAIIDEMKKGDYRVVCVGRRGASSAQGSFPASMAEKILWEARGKVVWVID
jgi:nucleotide-binding universal stress UspA family protein